jgi:hypothetical protein
MATKLIRANSNSFFREFEGIEYRRQETGDRRQETEYGRQETEDGTSSIRNRKPAES